MVGMLPLVPQIEEENVLNFDRSEIAVAFMMDICKEDLQLIEKYYKRALDKTIYTRMQNTMRIRGT